MHKKLIKKYENLDGHYLKSRDREINNYTGPVPVCESQTKINGKVILRKPVKKRVYLLS